MEIKNELKNFKEKFDPVLADFFRRAITETEEKDKFLADALRHIKKITMSGGKRLRPALMYYGYLGTGGKDKKEILQVAVSVELIHSFLLIHDDIIDRDATRHGVRTTHLQYKKMAKEFLTNDILTKHFGNSMAIIIGDTVNTLGNRAILESNFNEELILKALKKMQIVISDTVIGEALDVLISFSKKAGEKDLLKVCEYKTAKYTIESPLHLGAILAGANESSLREITEFAIPLGIAFQIQDDILGIFGATEKIGKPVGSDIAEGKQTILVARAEKKGNNRQKKILKSVLGKENLTGKDIDDFRKIIVDTGSLKYAKKLAQKYIVISKKQIAKTSLRKETKEFLLAIAGYMLSREV